MRRLHLTRRACAGRERGACGAAMQEPRPRVIEDTALHKPAAAGTSSQVARHVSAARVVAMRGACGARFIEQPGKAGASRDR